MPTTKVGQIFSPSSSYSLINFRFYTLYRSYMHHIINSMKCINQSLYDTYPNKDISFTISKYQLSSVSPHVQLLKVPREILSSVDHYYISFYPSFQLPIYWRRLICAGNTIIPTEEEISKRKVARIRQTTETLETLIVVKIETRVGNF